MRGKLWKFCFHTTRTPNYLGYKPKPVKNFRCISYNWQNMKCIFERLSNPIASRYELTYYFDDRSLQVNDKDKAMHRSGTVTLKLILFLQTNLCPLSGDYNRTYWCNLGFGGNRALYRQHYRYYYFILTSTNDIGVLTENFTIDNHGIGKTTIINNKVTFDRHI